MVAVLATVLLVLLTWPVSHLFPDSHHAHAIGAAHRPGLASLPLAAEAPVSAALGADVPAYAARVENGALVTSNAAQRLGARFDRSGAHVHAVGVGFGLTLAAVGQGSSLDSLAGVAPRGNANRVVYAYPGVSESFVNGPLGLDQRFTLARAPAHGAGPLTLSLSLSGDVHARVLAGGKGVVFTGTGGHVLDYRGLAATDARGHALRAWLSVHGGRVLVHVDARGASYPVSIDPLIQQGSHLTDLGGEGEVGDGLFGASIALSSDGSTVVVGAPREYREHTGAAFVFVRSGSTWSQQAELQDSEVNPYEEFGTSVALSADGDTAAIGAEGDRGAEGYTGGKGAVWVFTRSGSSWSEQTKLVADCTSSCANQGTGETSGLFGVSVGLSSDGNTLIAGALYDEPSPGAYDEGAAWVFTRSGSSWSEQAKLVGDCTSSCANEGSGESAYGYFGAAVALSGDGDTAVIGAPDNESETGASWIFSRSGATWSEQAKLVADCSSSCANEGTGEAGEGYFGSSVAVSEDGSTALIGGPYDDSNRGAAWVFTDSGASWSQQTELVGDCTSSCANQATGESGNGEFGSSAALSADGDTAVIGARGDEAAIGAAWVLKRSGSSWTQDGAKLVANCTVNCEYEGTGETGNDEEHNEFGYGVAVSPDGSTVMIGAPAEYNGGVWAFAPVNTATISDGPTSEVTQSGCSFTITGKQAVLNAGAVEGCLGSNGSASITDEAPSSSIHITTPVSGTKSSLLTLIASGAIAQTAPIKTGTLKATAPEGVSLTNEENEVSSFEGESEESGNVEVDDSCGVAVKDAATAPGWSTVVDVTKRASAFVGRDGGGAKADAGGGACATVGKIAQTGPIKTGTLKATAPEGVKLTNSGNSSNTFEATDTTSGNVEYTNTGNLSLGAISVPGKGKVAIALKTAQAGATAAGPIAAGTVTVKADQMHLSGGSVAAKGSVTLAPVSAGQPIDLGGGTPDALSLSAADINAVRAKKLTVGGTKAGPITVSGAIAPTNTDSLALETPGVLDGSGAGSISVATLALLDKEPEAGATWTITPSSVAEDGDQQLPYSAAAELDVKGGKVFAVTASGGTKYSLAGSAKSPKGTLDYDAQGRTVSGSLSPPKGAIDSPGVKPVSFAGMVAVNIANRAP